MNFGGRSGKYFHDQAEVETVNKRKVFPAPRFFHPSLSLRHVMRVSFVFFRFSSFAGTATSSAWKSQKSSTERSMPG